MWIVRLALDRPYTFVVMAIAILLAGIMAALNIPTDIFPNINIPIVSVVWTYSGMLPADMSGRIVYFFERTLTTQVNDVKAIESQSLNGYGVIRISFQPGVNINSAMAQVTSAAQTVVKRMPPGITPPYVLRFSAGTVPVIRLTLSGKTASQIAMFDQADNFIRPAVADVAGASVPSPYGGLNRSIMADLNLQAMEADGISPDDVVKALLSQNLVIPAGTQKIGPYENYVELNASPQKIDEINDMPVKQVNGTVIYMRDVAFVHNGAPPQTSMVRVNGTRAVMLPVFKIGSASTLAIVAGVKDRIPQIQKSMPKGLTIDTVGDESVFVRAAIVEVLREGAIAAALTAVMILLFLGSWRSTVIIAVSIPLAVLAALTVLWALGESLNVMTAGGLALAVGMLVDDATVTIENINVHLDDGKKIYDAIMAGAQQIAIPALVSVLAISIVFVPMFTLSGISHYLFMPMAEAVIFAMAASYILSRTLVPTMALYLLRSQEKTDQHEGGGGDEQKDGDEKAEQRQPEQQHQQQRPERRSRNPLVHVRDWLTRFQQGFDRRFRRVGDRYHGLLERALHHPYLFLACFAAVVGGSLVLEPWLGRDFFPRVNGAEIALHVRAHSGTRIEDTARLCDQIEREIRHVIPAKQLKTIVDNIDLPYNGINIAYSNTGTIGPQDADITVTLKPDHSSTQGYINRLRARLPRLFSGTQFAFLPADITSQVLNFGLPSSIDVQVTGEDLDADHQYATKLLHKIQRVTGVDDARIQQVFNYPQVNVKVDRTLAQQVGLTEKDVADSMLSVLSGSFQVQPNFWLDVKSGVTYPLEAEMPQFRIDTTSDLNNVLITSADGKGRQILGALGGVTRSPADAVVSHYNVKPVVDIYATHHGRNLGAIESDIDKILHDSQRNAPKNTSAAVRGQVETMHEAYSQLFPGIGAAILLIYLLVVVNFQSWLDPFVIVTGLPAALAGITWILFLTFTPLSVPALTGTIMCMGVATSNSVLVISFAREQLAGGKDSLGAALEAGSTRLRPVLMTALAMIIGMGPMALGVGTGGAQNAPLGRAVIGGLSFATISTLFFVPVVFSLVHRKDKPKQKRKSHPQGDKGQPQQEQHA